MIGPSKDWLEKMASIEDESDSVSVGGMASDVGMTMEIPEDGGIDPCAVERWIHQGQHATIPPAEIATPINLTGCTILGHIRRKALDVPDDEVFVHNVKGLMDDWLHWRSRGMDAVASSCRDRLAEIIESIKRI